MRAKREKVNVADEDASIDAKDEIELERQRARLRFLRDEGLEFLASYRAITLKDEREKIETMLIRLLDARTDT